MVLSGLRKIISLAGKLIPSDVRSVTSRITGSVKKGYQIGKRCSSIYDKGTFKGIGTTAKSVKREVGKLKFTRDEIPALAASITYMIPIPSPIPITPIVYGAGHGINKGLKLTNKIINHIF